MKQYTREEAIQLVGIEAVKAVEKENCEWDSGGGEAMGIHDTVQTWRATSKLPEDSQWQCIYSVYYVHDEEFINSFGDPIDDLSDINWRIDHYLLD
jgi:hypothetical protein